jgi:hypothetical protein
MMPNKEPTEDILQKLAGSDRRSTGRADEVTEEIAGNAQLFEVVFNAMQCGDPVLRMRAADAAEKTSRLRPELLAPYKEQLLNEIAGIDQQEVRWHVAQMIPRLELDAAERERAIAILESYLDDESKIVQVNALQALADLSEGDEQLQRRFFPILTEYAEQGSPALKARVRKLLKKINP